MADDRSTRALARIEAALARIESARPAPVAGAGAAEAELIQLQARHTRLRSAVEAQLGQLDLLIGEQGR